MKICFFANARNVHVPDLAGGLAERGHQVHVVTHKPANPQAGAADIRGVTVERFAVPPPGLVNLRRWHGRWTKYLRGFLHRFDVCLVFFLHEYGFTPEILEAGCLIASPRGSDIVPPPGETPPSEGQVAKRIALLKHAAGVGVGGPAFARIVADFAGIDVKHIDLLPLGVDLDLFRPEGTARSTGQRQDDKTCHGPYRVGFFKGFREVYGSTYLLQAIPRVVERIPDVRFDLIGEGPQLPRCKELAVQSGVESSVRWIPPQRHGDMPGHLASWDVTVMPSLCESFGLAALESSAMAVPVVASNVGGLVDTVRHQETGILIPPAAPETLAEAIVTLLDDAPGRARMGRAGRNLVRHEYERNAVLDRWMEVFRRALDRVATVV